MTLIAKSRNSSRGTLAKDVRSRRLIELLTIVAGLAFAVALVTAAPASASVAVSATCDVSGTLDASPPFQLESENAGTYRFSNFEMSCEGTINGVPDLFTNNLSTSGTYTNQLCTAEVFDSTTSTATVATSVAGHAGTTFSFPYRINIAGGFGHIWFFNPAKGFGTIDMVPTAPQSPNSLNPATWPCTSTLAVAGEFSLTVQY
jgi:hypothetical protein